MTSPHAASTAPAVDTPLDGSTPAEPLHHYLERRRRAGSRFSAGEAVTLTVGLLRGCARLRDRSDRICWWLTDDGRPLALPDDDATDAIGETLDVLTAVDALCEPSGSAVVARCRDAVAALSPRFWDEVERRAFAAAEPEPLVLGPFFPQASAPDAPGDHAVQSAPPLLPLVDADLAMVLRRALGDLRARWLRLPVRSKRLVGAGATAVVLTAVVVALTVSVPGRADESRGAGAARTTPPPAQATSPVTADEDGSSRHGPAGRGAGDEGSEATAGSGATADAAWRGRGDDAAQERADDGHQGSVGDATAGHPGEGEPTAVAEARRLLAADLACGGDDDCRGAIWERPPATPVEIDPARARLSLVDDFGGLAVVRVDADAHARHITLVRTDDEWLVRDVRIVTDQPS